MGISRHEWADRHVPLLSSTLSRLPMVHSTPHQTEDVVFIPKINSMNLRHKGESGSGTWRKNRPRLKKYLCKTDGMNAWTWWTNKEVGHNQEATKDLNAISVTGNTFDTAKPTWFLKRVIERKGCENEHDLILDYFAGIGNDWPRSHQPESGRRRRPEYILVEMGEHFDTVS